MKGLVTVWVTCIRIYKPVPWLVRDDDAAGLLRGSAVRNDDARAVGDDDPGLQEGCESIEERSFFFRTRIFGLGRLRTGAVRDDDACVSRGRTEQKGYQHECGGDVASKFSHCLLLQFL